MLLAKISKCIRRFLHQSSKSCDIPGRNLECYNKRTGSEKNKEHVRHTGSGNSELTNNTQTHLTVRSVGSRLFCIPEFGDFIYLRYSLMVGSLFLLFSWALFLFGFCFPLRVYRRNAFVVAFGACFGFCGGTFGFLGFWARFGFGRFFPFRAAGTFQSFADTMMTNLKACFKNLRFVVCAVVREDEAIVVTSDSFKPWILFASNAGDPELNFRAVEGDWDCYEVALPSRVPGTTARIYVSDVWNMRPIGRPGSEGVAQLLHFGVGGFIADDEVDDQHTFCIPALLHSAYQR